MKQRQQISSLRQKLADWKPVEAGKPTSEEKQDKENLEAELAVLADMASKHYFDEGPVYDCVVLHDGTKWRAAVDVSETGDLSQTKLMTDYKLGFACFSWC